MSFLGSPNNPGTTVARVAGAIVPAPGTVLPSGGIALVNGTPTLLTYIVPNDGNVHALVATQIKLVTVAETGGTINLNYVLQGGAKALQFDPGGRVPGQFQQVFAVMADPGTAVTIAQVSALTAGASSWTGAISLLM
jgi:hypothetical protein